MTPEIDLPDRGSAGSGIAVLDVHGRSADPVERADPDGSGEGVEAQKAGASVAAGADGDGIGIQFIRTAAEPDGLDGIARRTVGGDGGGDDGAVGRQNQDRTIFDRAAAAGVGRISDAKRPAAEIGVEGPQPAHIEGRGVADARGRAVADLEAQVGRGADVADLEGAGAGDGQPGRRIDGRVVAHRESSVDLKGLARPDRDGVRDGVVGLDQHRTAEARAGGAEVQRERGGATDGGPEVERVGDAGERLVDCEDQRAFVQRGRATVGIRGTQGQRARAGLLEVEGVQAVINHAVHRQIAGRHGDRDIRPQGHGARTHHEAMAAGEGESCVPVLRDIPSERQGATGSVVEDAAVEGERPAAEGVGVAKIEGRSRGYGDAARGPGVIPVEGQAAVGEGGEAAIGIGAVKDQDAGARLRQAEGGGAVADGSADGQSLGGDGGDDVVPERHGPRAEVQGIRPREGEVAVPVLDVVAGVDDRGRTRVEGGAGTDAERTRAEGAVVADDQGARRQDETT